MSELQDTFDVPACGVTTIDQAVYRVRCQRRKGHDGAHRGQGRSCVIQWPQDGADQQTKATEGEPYTVNGLTLYKPLDPEDWAKADIVRKLRTDRFNCNLELQAEAADEIEKWRNYAKTMEQDAQHWYRLWSHACTRHGAGTNVCSECMEVFNG